MSKDTLSATEIEDLSEKLLAITHCDYKWHYKSHEEFRKAFDNDEFVAAMEAAENKVGTENTEGLKLQQEFTYEKSLNKILEVIQSDTQGVTPSETS